MSDGKVIHPAAKDRIDLFDQCPDRLGAIATEQDLKLSQQYCAFLHQRHAQRHPPPGTTPHSAKLKAQESEALSFRQVHLTALLLVHLHLQLGQLLAKSVLYRFAKPPMPRIAPVV